MKVIWTPEAVRDKVGAWNWYAERSPDYADRLIGLLESRAALLGRFPGLGRTVRGPLLRDLSIPEVQYVLAYRIEEDAVRILRVWSTRQNREQP